MMDLLCQIRLLSSLRLSDRGFINSLRASGVTLVIALGEIFREFL